MKRTTIAASTVLLALCAALSGPAEARTWYVDAYGTGDAPTIAAALDSVSAGDSVLVGPGEYFTPTCHTIPPDVVVASEMGPLETWVRADGPLSAVCIFNLLERSELRGFGVSGAYLTQVFTDPDCTVANNVIDGRPGLHMDVHDRCTISNNLFLDGAGIEFSSAPLYRPLFRNNIVLCPILCYVEPVAVCNDLLYTNSPCVQTLLAGPGDHNFSADPQFCGVPGSGNYYLQSDSPCAEGNTPYVPCGQVGPLPVGCSLVETEAKSWGQIKAMYRE